MVILGLGSNVGDRLAHLRAAVRLLSDQLGVLVPSRIYESSALLPDQAPKDWDMPFLNMAVCAQTDFSPARIFSIAKAIERAVGRQVRGVWGPREIDIDILAMGDVVLDSESLKVPHAELINRDFALLPLMDIAPGWRFPAGGKYQGWTARDIVSDRGFSAGATLKVTDLSL